LPPTLVKIQIRQPFCAWPNSSIFIMASPHKKKKKKKKIKENKRKEKKRKT